MYDILSVGEAIIDFISLESGKHLTEVKRFLKQPGGSCVNVAFGLGKLKSPVMFTGIVGDDFFGEFLENHLKKNKIDCALLKKTNKYHTPLVFVGLDKKGNNCFFFYRSLKLGNLYQITAEDLKKIKNAGLLHFSSVVLYQKNFQNQLSKMLNEVKNNNKGLIHFDVNIRFSLWKNTTELRRLIIKYINASHIVKLSENELYFAAQTRDMKKALEKDFLKNKLAVITLGKKGCLALHNGVVHKSPGFKIKAVDSTGAGDAFVAAFLSCVQKENLKPSSLSALKDEKLLTFLKFSNAAAALNCLKHGATSGMSPKKSILDFIKKGKK